MVEKQVFQHLPFSYHFSALGHAQKGAKWAQREVQLTWELGS